MSLWWDVDDAMLYLLESGTHLGSLSIRIPEPCVLINFVPDPSLPSSNLSIGTYPIPNSSTSTTMHMFSYVAKYGTNYLLESPRFMTVVLARMSHLTSLYIHIDHRSLAMVQELVNGTAHTLENIGVLLNNWPRDAGDNVNLSLCSNLASLSLGQDYSSLTVLCKSLVSCPRDVPVKDIGLSIQTSPLLQSDVAWCNLADMFRSDIYFFVAEQLDIDIYTRTARDAAEAEVKNIVDLACSHLATACPNLMAKVHHKLVSVSLEGYQKYSYLHALARSFELDAITVSDIHLLSELLQLFDSSINLKTLVVSNVDFYTSLCLSICSMAHRFCYLMLNGCKIDGLHVATLLSSMTSVKTVSFGDVAVSYYHTLYFVDIVDINRLAALATDYSVNLFVYNCDAQFDRISFDTRRLGDTLQQSHPLINDASFLHALLPRLAAAQHVSLFIHYYSHESALRVLASCGTTLLSLSLVYMYNHRSEEPANVTLPMCQSLTNLHLTLHLEDLTTLLSSIPAQTKLMNLHVTIHITDDRFDTVSWYEF
ncbi:uncharacterized protein ARMOST_20342 [Armillaria ostoyae]|uniref:Uncharacterized protein n=1 Tax=Armillaria ostoyae TaxID=47428 RepID=A0A284S738_ARMOS|nr:uncharacterized protein ARMOST_20342 [Armillaria ostoyae]